MARSRVISPGFFTDADLYDAEADSGLPLMLAYAGLWCQADRDGRFVWKPRELKLHILPFHDVDFSAVLEALAAAGFIVRYTVEGRRYGVIPTFLRYQKIHPREAKSALPSPEDADTKDNPRHAQGEPEDNPRQTRKCEEIVCPPVSTSTSVSTSVGDDEAGCIADASTAAPTPDADLRDWIPAEYHPDLDGALRASANPAALLATLRLIRREPELRNLSGVTGTHVGEAIRDATLKRVLLSGKSLAGFIRAAQRSPPPEPGASDVIAKAEAIQAHHDRLRASA